MPRPASRPAGAKDPVLPEWQRFSREYNRFAIDTLGATVSPTQTQWLVSGDVKIPRRLARPRFTTAYYRHDGYPPPGPHDLSTA